MAKIEDLAELLVTELNNFEKGLVKLETIESRINKTEIPVNIKELNQVLNEYDNTLAKNKETQERYFSRLNSLVENAKIYPKWAVITFIATLLLCCSAMFYAYTVKENSNTIEKVAYEKGLDTYGNYINEFFENSPKSKHAFEKWERENN